MSGTSDSPSCLSGGCQCGAVRYELRTAPTLASVCHCRMCQKATGSPIAAFARVSKSDLHWTHGAPGAFRSSNFVERNFCSACGTPLTYNFMEGGNISVTICSLDDPEAVKPTKQYCPSSELSWFASIRSLPKVEEFFTAEQKTRFVNNQCPDTEAG